MSTSAVAPSEPRTATFRSTPAPTLWGGLGARLLESTREVA